MREETDTQTNTGTDCFIVLYVCTCACVPKNACVMLHVCTYVFRTHASTHARTHSNAQRTCMCGLGITCNTYGSGSSMH